MILQEPHSGACLNSMFAPEFCRDHKLAFRGECSTWLSHVLHYSRGKSRRTYVGLETSCRRVLPGSRTSWKLSSFGYVSLELIAVAGWYPTDAEDSCYQAG